MASTPRPAVAALVALLVAVATGCRGEPTVAGGSASTVDSSSARESAVVDYVIDGDTLRTADGRTVRLLQIDAPELHDECYGRAALAALRRLVPSGARITLRRDPGLDDRDAYGRVLRYVFAGRRNVNVTLVRAGAASPYFFRAERGRYAGELLGAVRKARARRAGAWGSCPQAELNTGLGSLTGSA